MVVMMIFDFPVCDQSGDAFSGTSGMPNMLLPASSAAGGGFGLKDAVVVPVGADGGLRSPHSGQSTGMHRTASGNATGGIGLGASAGATLSSPLAAAAIGLARKVSGRQKSGLPVGSAFANLVTAATGAGAGGFNTPKIPTLSIEGKAHANKSSGMRLVWPYSAGVAGMKSVVWRP